MGWTRGDKVGWRDGREEGCIDGKYEPKEKLKKNHTDRIRALKNNIKNFFSFKTYGELYNDITRLKISNKSSDIETYKNVISMYSNTIIVLDEVHMH